MSISKTSTKLFDSITVPGNSYTSPSAGVDLSDAIDLAVGYTMTFNAAANYGATIFLYGDPAGNSLDFVAGSYDNPIDECPIDGKSKAGHTVSGVYQFNHSAKYVKFRVYNHDDTVSITNCSIWAIVQKP